MMKYIDICIHIIYIDHNDDDDCYPSRLFNRFLWAVSQLVSVVLKLILKFRLVLKLIKNYEDIKYLGAFFLLE